jgi:hypothetical protein
VLVPPQFREYSLTTTHNGRVRVLSDRKPLFAEPAGRFGQTVVYSTKRCHLCEIVKESIAHNDEVPVVFINGRKAFKYRMDEQEFLRKLAR